MLCLRELSSWDGLLFGFVTALRVRAHAVMAESTEGRRVIPIPNISPRIFLLVMHYVYSNHAHIDVEVHVPPLRELCALAQPPLPRFSLRRTFVGSTWLLTSFYSMDSKMSAHARCVHT